MNKQQPTSDGLDSVRRPLPDGLYGILGEKFSRGRSNLEVAEEMIRAGVDVLQYREKVKDKSLKEIFRECRELRKMTRDAGIPLIINDFVDIALLVEADGVHQGQDDLPLKELRRLAPEMIVGYSTHSPEQARQAILDGADYIGVGPIFSTRTKENVCDPVGLEYLDYVVQHHDIPFVALGGIKLHNLEQVLSHGAKTICLVTEIIGADNIGERVQQIKQQIGGHQ